ncbi:MAG TPA: carcinine hydrolase/isopenicillin-N N-acyltransferase family protein, partial [Candidatus Eremiobacteraeota bacterium]|nr:carcinine hydrolase/isopenicillin-N N-acyltransferase family protein [Candidatus Eremiobacteraeota bacterium]
MQKLKQVIIILYLIFSITFPVKACTLWAATGKCTENNTTLIVKNRDWKPDNHNELMLIIPEKGYSFLALYSAGGGYEGVKGGINEKGLVIVTATASTIPSEERVEGKGFLIELLRNYESVKAVLENREIFSSGKPGFYMIGDREHIAVIEIGMNGEFAVKEIEDGILYHTNHYTDEKLLKF